MLGLSFARHFPEPHTMSVDDLEDEATVLVVFVGKTECRCLRWLKRGFRHCFVALRASDKWLICDSLKNRMKFSIVELPPNFSLSQFYRDQGHIVVAGHGSVPSEGSFLLPEPMTCVTVVKRIVGVRSFWTITPWQLFCRLSSMTDDWRLVR